MGRKLSQEALYRPLGIRSDVSLSPDQLASLRILEEFDLGPVKQRLLADGAMPPTWVDEALLEFRRYLALCAVVHGPLPMVSRQVDRVWHTCLLFSRLYADLCDRAFNVFVHHEPNMEMPADPQGDWEQFKRVYERTFGDLGGIWLKGLRRP